MNDAQSKLIAERVRSLEQDFFHLAKQFKRLVDHVQHVAEQSGVDPAVDGNQAEVPQVAPVAEGEEVVAEGATDLSCMW